MQGKRGRRKKQAGVCVRTGGQDCWRAVGWTTLEVRIKPPKKTRTHHFHVGTTQVPATRKRDAGLSPHTVADRSCGHRMGPTLFYLLASLFLSRSSFRWSEKKRTANEEKSRARKVFPTTSKKANYSRFKQETSTTKHNTPLNRSRWGGSTILDCARPHAHDSSPFTLFKR